MPAPAIITIAPQYSTVNTIQPSQVISITGTNLANTTALWNGGFPFTLGGTLVHVDTILAYMIFVSPTLILCQCPNGPAPGSATVDVDNASGSGSGTVTIATYAPSFLLLDSTHVSAIIIRLDGSGAYGGGGYDIVGPAGNSLGYATVPAAVGDNIAIYLGGLGPTTPTFPAGHPTSGYAALQTPITSLTVNGVSVTPSFVSQVGVGLYQINLTVPAGLGTGDQSIVVTVSSTQTTQSGTVISLQ